METLTERLRKSSKDWNDQGTRFVNDARSVGQTFVGFVQTEAKGWGEYLFQRSRELGDQGWQYLSKKSPLKEPLAKGEEPVAEAAELTVRAVERNSEEEQDREETQEQPEAAQA